MARGKEIDRATVEMVLQMKKRNEKLTTEQIGAVVQCDASTAGRIIKTGSWEGYCAWKAEKAKKEREKNRQPEEKPEREPEVPGQIEMDLTKKEPEEQDRIVKLMRFQAHEVDLILKQISECFDMLILKTDKLNDTMSMILRAMRKE